MATLNETNVDWNSGIYQIETTDPVMAGNGGIANLQALELAKRTRDLKDNKVDKVTGKVLSTNDYTTTEKTKLAGIATNANNYIHPTTHSADIITENANKRFVTDVEKTTFNTTIPIGGIIMWSGTSAAVPSNYIICDGTRITVGTLINQYTPNLKDRFIVGVSTTKTVKSTGGSSTKSIGIANLPAHSHEINISSGLGGGVLCLKAIQEYALASKIYTGDNGSGTPLDVTPPYYALYFIMRIL